MSAIIVHPSAALRAEVLHRHHRITRAGRLVARLERTRLLDAAAAGEALTELKALLGHGNWMDWCRRELPELSHRTVTRYIGVARLGRVGELDSLSNLDEAYALLRKRSKAARQQRRRENPPHLDPRTIGLAVADSPWDLDGFDYATLSVEQLCNYTIRGRPVRDWLAPNSLMLFCAVDGYLEESFQVMRAWGLTYRRRSVVWEKPNAAPHPWLNGQHELALIASRGEVSPLPAGTTLLKPAMGCFRQHSQKPDELFDLAERLWPTRDGHKLELFARPDANGRYPRGARGWVGWGDEFSWWPEEADDAVAA